MIMRKDYNIQHLTEGDREEKPRLLQILRALKKLQKKVEGLTDYSTTQYLKNPDKSLVKKINVYAFLIKILEINCNFLQHFIDLYDIKEPVIHTALSRGIFESHLILREATADEKNFMDFTSQVHNSYKRFIERFKEAVERDFGEEAGKTFNKELERISSLRKKYENLFQHSLDGSEKKSKVYFAELAKKYGYSKDYEFYYSILSEFLHPSFLYILTTLPKDKTLSQEAIERIRHNIEERRIMIKIISTRVAYTYSLNTKKYIEGFLGANK